MLLSRRRLLKLLGRGSLWAAVAVGTGPILGRALTQRWQRIRRRRPDDLAPIPWIGHC